MLLSALNVFSRVGFFPCRIIFPHDPGYGISELPLYSAQLTVMKLCNISQRIAVHDQLQSAQHVIRQIALCNQVVQINVGTLNGLGLSKATLGVQRRSALLPRMICCVQLAPVLQQLRHYALFALGQIRPF